MFRVSFRGECTRYMQALAGAKVRVTPQLQYINTLLSYECVLPLNWLTGCRCKRTISCWSSACTRPCSGRRTLTPNGLRLRTAHSLCLEVTANRVLSLSTHIHTDCEYTGKRYLCFCIGKQERPKLNMNLALYFMVIMHIHIEGWEKGEWKCHKGEMESGFMQLL